MKISKLNHIIKKYFHIISLQITKFRLTFRTSAKLSERKSSALSQSPAMGIKNKRVKNMKSKMSEGRKVSLSTASEARKSEERSEAGRQVGILQHHKYLPILLSGTFKSQQW